MQNYILDKRNNKNIKPGKILILGILLEPTSNLEFY